MDTPVLDVLRPVLRVGTRAYFGLRFEGIEHIPRSGPLIIACNHVTYADPVLVSIPVRRPVHYMAWDRLFRVPGLAWLIRHLRAFPVDLESADRRATREAVRILHRGEAVMIFPEGGRSLDGRLQPFKAGAFRLACSLRVPVLPVTIVGGYECWPPGRTLPRPGPMVIRYHAVMNPAALGNVKAAARSLASAVREVMGSALPAHQRPASDEPERQSEGAM